MSPFAAGFGRPRFLRRARFPRASAARAREAFVPIASVGALLLFWQFGTRALGIPSYMLPVPSEFLREFWTIPALLARHAMATSGIILGGFVLGTLVAVPLALLIVSSRVLQKGLYPVLVVLQIAPKTIIAPLLIVWYGTGSMSKLMLTTIMTFFPILVDSMAGFRAVDRRLFLIARSMGATRLQTMWRIRIPAALPFIFSGLKIGMISAVTGSMVVEYVGSNRGLGYLTLLASSHFDIPLMFAAILTTTFVGLSFNAVILAVERIAMPWRESGRH